MFNPSRYHALAIFLAMGAFGALFAWNSFDLVRLAMANSRFLQMFGWLGAEQGGLVQLVEISLRGFLSLGFYVAFKACEVELVQRWRARRE